MRIARETLQVGLSESRNRYWLVHEGRKAGPYPNIHVAGAAAKRLEAALEKRKVVA